MNCGAKQLPKRVKKKNVIMGAARRQGATGEMPTPVQSSKTTKGVGVGGGDGGRRRGGATRGFFGLELATKQTHAETEKTSRKK